MIRGSAHSDASLALTIPIALLLTLAAGSGAFTSGLYRDAPDLVAQAIGQDIVSLFVALPALVISAVLAGKGSRAARLIWLGVLIYVAYTYASYAFGIRFNPLFLVYVAPLGLSTYTLIVGLLATDQAGIENAFGRHTPVRAVSIFLLVIAALFYLIWLSEALPASLNGTAPQSVQQDGTPTNVIHVLVMGLLLPALIIAAVSLWRRRPIGYILAAALMANLVFLPLAILSMSFFQARAGEPVSMPLIMIFAALFAASIGMLIWHMQSLRRSGGTDKLHHWRRGLAALPPRPAPQVGAPSAMRSERRQR
jgi:hypothetical protein